MNTKQRSWIEKRAESIAEKTFKHGTRRDLLTQRIINAQLDAFQEGIESLMEEAKPEEEKQFRADDFIRPRGVR
jgi:hypothetical protein